jgi:hypothetical protein
MVFYAGRAFPSPFFSTFNNSIISYMKHKDKAVIVQSRRCLAGLTLIIDNKSRFRQTRALGQ